MRLEDKINKAYNEKVTEPNNYQELEDKIGVKKTHHYLFQSLKITGIVAASMIGFIILAAAGVVLAASIHVHDDGVKSLRKTKFTVYDTNLVKSETFKALNTITYNEQKESNPINAHFIDDVNGFANNSFSYFNKENNLAYSPLMLYSQLDLISLAASDDETKAQFNQILNNDDEDLRADNIAAAMKNNFFVDASTQSTVQTKNAVFIENTLGANQNFVDGLTRRNAEAYSLHFQNDKDVNKVIEWANKSVNEDGFLNKNDLEIQDDSALLFLSSLYFNNSWSSKFKTEDTNVDNFYLSKDETIQTKFMNHLYYGKIAVYEKYVAVTDYYNDAYSIQYFVPNDVKDNIFDVLPNNFLSIGNDANETMISLSLPKFQITSSCDLGNIVQQMGLTNPYVDKSNHLKNAFEEPEIIEYSYLTYTKQKTSVAFNEDGTVIKSITMSMGAAGTAAPMKDGYKVDLNQPFVYCIRDSSGLPLLVGTIVNPSK